MPAINRNLLSNKYFIEISSVVLVGLLFLNLFDIVSALQDPGAYPFGSAFFPRNSIYQSQEIYVWYHFLESVFAGLALFFLYKRKMILFVAAVSPVMLFLIYPLNIFSN